MAMIQLNNGQTTFISALDEDCGLTEEHRKTLDNALNLLMKHV